MRNIFFAISLIVVFLSACTPKEAPIEGCTARTISGTIYSTPIPNSIVEDNPPSAAYIEKSLDSPNRKFTANYYSSSNYPLGVIEIRDKAGDLLWQIPYQGELPAGDPSPSLNIFQWSNDSAYLYYYYSWGADGMEVAFWWTGYDLLKINIETGETQKVLPNKDKEFISFAISPDETQIAYFRCQDQPNVIYIRNLETGQERTAKVASVLKNYVIAGDIYWAPSGDGLVFQTQDDNFMIQTIYLNLTKMKQKVVKEYPLYFAPDWKRLQLQGWVDNRKLEYREEGDMGVQIIHLDIETMKTTMIGTSTPNP
jgi:hypothetical protein